MKIFNIMLSKGLGGIEQVFLDYTSVLRDKGHDVTSIFHPHAALAPKITGDCYKLYNLNQYDFIAVLRLKNFIRQEKPDLVVTHGNRATVLYRKTKCKIKHFAVCHNYKIKPLIGSDQLISITDHIKQHAIKLGQHPDTIQVVPNMTALPTSFRSPPAEFRNPPVIGFLGRLVHKKGADIFIKALEILAAEKIPFKALIAGDGPDKDKLHVQVQEAQLSDKVEFVGWISDKKNYFDQLDVFCLPSHSEPFGLVLLEAFGHGKPVVSTKASGPFEIARHEKDVLFSELGDPVDMAHQLKRLLDNKNLQDRLREEGYKTAERHSPEVIATRLDEVLNK